MGAPTLAQRVGFPGDHSIFRAKLSEIKASLQVPDPVDRLVFGPGELVQCDLWFPNEKIIPSGFVAVCDGRKGLPEAINTTWEKTVVQQCIVHLIHNSFRYAGRQHRDGIVRALKPVYYRPVRAGSERPLHRIHHSVGQSPDGCDHPALEIIMG